MDTDIKINIVLPQKESNLLANATVILDTYSCGEVTIKGFQVWKSNNFNDRLQERINIAAPSKRFYSRYLPQVFIEDKNKWYLLEERIYEAYKEKIRAHREEKVDPDAIPI